MTSSLTGLPDQEARTGMPRQDCRTGLQDRTAGLDRKTGLQDRTAGKRQLSRTEQAGNHDSQFMYDRTARAGLSVLYRTS